MSSYVCLDYQVRLKVIANDSAPWNSIYQMVINVAQIHVQQTHHHGSCFDLHNCEISFIENI